MLVVIEGLDGAGKSTQVRLMKEYLSKVCNRLEYIHFPRYDAPVYGDLIGKFLRGGFGPMDKVHPQLVALLFAEDRRDAAPSILKVLSEGGTVLLDRYVYSNIAYQCAKLPGVEEAEELREWILNTEYGVFGLPRPDLNIFLDVPIDFVEQSLSRQRNGGDRTYLHGGNDIHEADIEFQKRVRAMYQRQASLDKSFVIVDCAAEDGSMLPPERIFAKLRAVYEER
jgi:dTMP kinase